MNKIERLPELWSILPYELSRIKHDYHSFLTGDKLLRGYDYNKLTALDRPSLEGTPETFFMVGDVAIIKIQGVIMQKPSFFSFFFGGAILEVLTRDFNILINDDEIKTIILEIDSPGGVVFGVQEFANLVYEGRSKKNIYAISSAMMASAACWIGSAANEVFISDESVMTGSLGVVAEHIDISELERKIGIKTTEVVAGKEKRIDSSLAPLSDAGREALQSRVDHIYNAMTTDIAKFRGVAVEDVLNNMADGKTFIGSQAINAGLVNEVLNIDELIDQIELAENLDSNISAANSNTFNFFDKGDNDMTVTERIGRELTAGQVREKHPKAYETIYNTGVESVREEQETQIAQAREQGIEEGQKMGNEDGRRLGAEGERNRIRAVEDQLIPGHEKLIETLKYDGKTTAAEAAMAILKADKESRQSKLEKLESEAVKPVGNSVEEKPVSKAKQEVKTEAGDINEDAIKANWDNDSTLQAEFGKRFDAYRAYVIQEAEGNIKILRK